MTALFFIISILALLAGHLFRLIRWEQFIKIYERPSSGYLLTGMAGGYALNFLLPFHLGDIFRAVFSGRKMRSGTGFGFATVLMDRFLDVWFVTLFFLIFRISRVSSDNSTLTYYLIVSGILLAVLIMIILFRNPIKRICLKLSGIFNDSIKLDVMMFLWSLINTFKDLRRVNIVKLLVNTIIMWGAYFASYASVARCLTYSGADKGIFDVFSLLFGTNGITKTTFTVAAGMGTGKERFLLISWLIIPILAMFLITALPRKTKDTLANVAGTYSDTEYENLLPQLDPNDRSIFLSRYFGLEDKEYLEKFLSINRNVSILQDYSAGSNATTMLCMDSSGTFFRKYAFGQDGEKLAEQLAWLKRNSGRLPLCKILRNAEDENCCWYDMEYDSATTDFFRFIHSNPEESSRQILFSILETMRSALYSTSHIEKAERIDSYISSKVDKNLIIIRESRLLKELLSFDTLVINGVDYRNMAQLEKLLDRKFLNKVFSGDPVSDIHGDLTIENIICRLDGKKSWYLIDPNTGNIHDSPYLDYAKLLQSLHGSYEFMMMTPRVSVCENHIDFQLTRSAAYDSLLQTLKSYLQKTYGKEAYQSILLHEVIHWLRLMPYKLVHDRKRVPMFFAGLVMVMNDAAKEIGIE